MPSFTIPKLTNRYILMMIGYGLILMMWLTLEENTVWIVSILGMGLAYGLVWLVIRGQWAGRTLPAQTWLWGGILLGIVGGLGSVLMTTLLMLMKNAQHSHASLDFPSEVVAGLWEITPYWILAGLVFNTGLVLFILATYDATKIQAKLQIADEVEEWLLTYNDQ